MVHSLVLQGNLRLLSKDTEACFVVGRQDRLSQNFFQTQEPTSCLESTLRFRNLSLNCLFAGRSNKFDLLSSPGN